MRAWAGLLLLVAAGTAAGAPADRFELTACPIDAVLEPGGSVTIRGEILAPRAGLELMPTAALRAGSDPDGTRALGLVGVWKVRSSPDAIEPAPGAHMPVTWRLSAPTVDTAAQTVDVLLGFENASAVGEPLVVRATLGAIASPSASCGRADYVMGRASALAPGDAWPLAGALVAGGTAIAFAVSAAHARSRRAAWWALGPLLPLFTRLRSDRLLDQGTRERIHHAVEAEPGITFAQLRAQLGLSTGVVDHHTRILVRAGLLVTHKEGRHRAYYARGAATAPESPRLGETATRLLAHLDAHGCATYAEIMGALALSKSAVSHHVHALEALGLVHLVQREDGRWVVERAGQDVRTNA